MSPLRPVSAHDPTGVRNLRTSGFSRRKGNLSIVAGAAAAVTILAGTATPGSAAAAPPAGAGHPAVTAPLAAPASPSTPTDRTARITCRLSIDDPYLSTDTPRAVKVIATVSCTAPVHSQEISVKLYRNGELEGQSGPVSGNGSATLQGIASASCTQDPSDQYFGTAEVNVTYPYGYSPPTWTASNRSFTSSGLDCD